MKIIYSAFMAFLFLISSLASAQNLKSPEEFLGYTLGERFTRHHKMVEYFRYVSEQMPNVKFEKYGETYEHRDLITVTLSSKENFDNLEEIRVNNLKLTGLEEGTPSGNKKAIVWLSYNVHGNESVSMEAAMQTLYELVDPENTKTQKWLENTVVIMDPCINPDGRDRYANFYNQYGNKIPNPDPNSKEHREPWPGGRANHYLFDLNRDWAWLKQTESAQRLKKYHEWMPHVHVDFHEQGVNSPYYFAPAAEPLHEVITDWQRNFQVDIGKNNAKYFDQNNWLYFTRERFDLLYPSYGDTYPVYNGAIGMTYEQGGSGRAGLTVLTEFDDELTLKDRISHHHSNGLSTVEITSLNADRVIGEFEKYFREAGNKAKYKTYIIKGTNKKDKLDQLASFLEKHKIEFGYPAASRRPVNGFDFQNNRNTSVAVSSNDIVINVSQAKSALITVLFEPKTKVSDSVTYDITAWNVPYAFGLETYASSENLQPSKDYAFSAKTNLLPDENAYAYVLPYQSFEDAKFLAYIQQKGVKVKAAAYPFSVEDQSFSRGSVIVTKRNNEGLGEDLVKILGDAAVRFNRKVYSLNTGFSDKGYDIGSNNMNYIPAPKVALIGGDQTNSRSFGEIWYFMEQELGYPVTVLDTEYLKRVDLADYDVLIVPNGYYSLFDEDYLKEISAWVAGGGRLILVQEALRSFAGKEGFGLVKKKGEEEDSSKVRRYENRERESISEDIIGAVFKVKVDDSHPLAFGYGHRYFSLKTSSNSYEYLKNGWNVGVLPAGSKAMNGFTGYKAEKLIPESLVFGVENKGRGRIVYMVDNPLFRAFWEEGKLLFSNAIFMTGQ